MSRVRRFLVISADVTVALNARIAEKDLCGPGVPTAITVPLWLSADDPEVDPARAYLANWNLRPVHWDRLQAWAAAQGVSINDETAATNAAAHYPAASWTLSQVLDDVTRKKRVLVKGSTDPLTA